MTAFDARRGWGTVADSAGAEFEFHSTALVDGSRKIDPGTTVGFVIVPGHRGRYEARALTVLPGPPGGGSASHHEPA